MIYTNIYLLKYKKFYYHDDTDNEDVEDVFIAGYFSSKEKAEHAIEKYIAEEKYDKEDMYIEEYILKMTKRQKYVYVTSYEFSILTPENEYIDYYYVFPPMISRKECIEYINKLKSEEKYKHNNQKIYDDESKEGFYITRYRIDCNYH